jgi:hypothetical protein
MFAIQAIPKNEVVVIWEGRDVDANGFAQLPESELDYYLRLDEDRWQIAREFGIREPADYVNHSCDPNCGMITEKSIATLRTIEIGEEITFDYAMTEGDLPEIPVSDIIPSCGCGSKLCRGRISSHDWFHQDLIARYAWKEPDQPGYSPYLRRRLLRMFG